MTGQTHIAAGVAGAMLLAVALHDPVTPALVVLAGIGGLAPDLDHPEALLTRHLPGGHAAAGTAQSLHLWRHRGMTHSFVALAVTTGLLLPLLGLLMAHLTLALGMGLGHPEWITALWHAWGADGYLGWAAGYASHLLVDALNTKGVQWFWPLPIWIKSPIPNITVGTWPELLFRWGLLLGIIWWQPVLGLITVASSEGLYRLVKSA